MKPDKNYINGIIFSAHKNLISRDKMLRIADTASAEEAFSAVKEHGYQVAELGAGDYQTALFYEEQKLLDFIRGCDFGEDIKAFCLAKNDFFNAECAVRGRHAPSMARARRPDGQFSYDEIAEGLKNDDSALGKAIKQAVSAAENLFAEKEPGGGEITTVFMRAYYRYALKKITDRRMKNVLRFDIDAKNISIALRSAQPAALKENGFEGGRLKLSDVEELCALSPSRADLKFAFTPEYDYIRAAMDEAAAGKPMKAFEKAADDYALQCFDDIRYDTRGKTPLLMYYLYKTAEIKNLRTIMSLKLIACPPDEIKSRLRKGYVG